MTVIYTSSSLQWVISVLYHSVSESSVALCSRVSVGGDQSPREATEAASAVGRAERAGSAENRGREEHPPAVAAGWRPSTCSSRPSASRRDRRRHPSPLPRAPGHGRSRSSPGPETAAKNVRARLASGRAWPPRRPLVGTECVLVHLQVGRPATCNGARCICKRGAGDAARSRAASAAHSQWSVACLWRRRPESTRRRVTL